MYNKFRRLGVKNILVINTTKLRSFKGWSIAMRYKRLNMISWLFNECEKYECPLISQTAKMHLELEKIALEIQLSKYVPRNPLKDLGIKTIGATAVFINPKSSK